MLIGRASGGIRASGNLLEPIETARKWDSR